MVRNFLLPSAGPPVPGHPSRLAPEPHLVVPPLEVGVGRQRVPEAGRGVVLLPDSRVSVEHVVEDEELDAEVDADEGEDLRRRQQDGGQQEHPQEGVQAAGGLVLPQKEAVRGERARVRGLLFVILMMLLLKPIILARVRGER